MRSLILKPTLDYLPLINYMMYILVSVCISSVYLPCLIRKLFSCIGEYELSQLLLDLLSKQAPLGTSGTIIPQAMMEEDEDEEFVPVGGMEVVGSASDTLLDAAGRPPAGDGRNDAARIVYVVSKEYITSVVDIASTITATKHHPLFTHQEAYLAAIYTAYGIQQPYDQAVHSGMGYTSPRRIVTAVVNPGYNAMLTSRPTSTSGLFARLFLRSMPHCVALLQSAMLLNHYTPTSYIDSMGKQ